MQFDSIREIAILAPAKAAFLVLKVNMRRACSRPMGIGGPSENLREVLAEAVSETTHIAPWKALHGFEQCCRIVFTLQPEVFRQ